MKMSRVREFVWLGVAPEQSSLKKRVVGAGLWTVGGRVVGQLVRMVSNLIMTRLLLPDMFGVVGIAYVILTGLSLLSDVGLSQNIVQSRRGNSEEFLNTAWTIQILRGLLLWIFGIAVAGVLLVLVHFGLIAHDTVYSDPDLPYVIVAVSFTAAIVGFRSTKFYEASRYLSFARLTIIGIIAQIAGLACMLFWAVFDRSVWVLVSGGIFASLVQSVLTHLCLPGCSNRWRWDRTAASEIFSFGKWIFVSSILGFFANSGDRLLLGGMIDSTSLGIYVIAILLFGSVDQILNSIIQSVGFPALSEVVRKGGPTKTAYYRIYAVIAFASYFAAGFLMVGGQAAVDLLYDARYAQAGWMLQVLAVGLIAVPSRLGIQYYMALGHSRAAATIAAARLFLLVTGIPAGFAFFGLPGAVVGVMISYLSYIPTNGLLSKQFDLIDIRRELLYLPIILLGGVVGMFFKCADGWLFVGIGW